MPSALVRDMLLDGEREQALRLVRTCLNVPGGHVHVPRTVVATNVAVAESEDDKLASVCLETLCELVVLDVTVVVHANGTRVVPEPGMRLVVG